MFAHRLCSVLLVLAVSTAARAQSITEDLKWLTGTQAVTGYEGPLSLKLMDELKTMHPQRDSMGNVTVQFGSGAPHRLVAAPMDEPGYVVSHIEPDGYLRVQRLPQTGLPPHYNEMQNAQPMLVGTRDGKELPAVVAGLSIHLTPGRANVPDPDDIDNMYIDMGAKTEADVLRSGVDVLSPLAAARSLLRVGPHRWAGTAVGDRFGDAVLLQLARALAAKPGTGTTTIAFVTQQYATSRGLIRVLETEHPDEVVFVGRGRKEIARQARNSEEAAVLPALGTGTIAFGTPATWFGSAMTSSPAAPFLQRGYGPAMALPTRTLHAGVPLLYPLTAGEMLDDRDLDALLVSLEKYVGTAATPSQNATAIAAIPYPTPAAKPASTPDIVDTLRTLTESYGVSEVETMPREAVARLLPPWVHPETDAAGNLIVRFGNGGKPSAVFMAHTDELGFRVRSINADGSLVLDNKGGGSPAFFWGHPALVHTSAGMLGAVVALPDGFDTAKFHFPADFRIAATLNVGVESAAEAAALGIKVGDFVTIPKHMGTLANGRVTVRSLDDRVGCTAMVQAVWALGKDFHRDVTFVWSTREELGLLGAAAFAESAAKAGATPKTVFAIDTFVSSDSPLESHRFADAKLGEGFVVRAIDGSNIVPWSDVQHVEALAKKHAIPVQYGATGGGNDGATFVRYGATDVALSWPLRYSHSPGEVIDMRDVRALADIVAVLSREW